MRVLVFSLVLLIGTASKLCSAAIVPLSSGAVRIAITNDPLAGQPGWVRTNETIVNVFFGLATASETSYLPGERVQIYNTLNQQKLHLGVVLGRADIHDERDQRGIYRNGLGSSLSFGSSANANALQQPTATPLALDASELNGVVPYVGPLALSAAVPEPRSLLVWLGIGAALIVTAIVRSRSTQRRFIRAA